MHLLTGCRARNQEKSRPKAAFLRCAKESLHYGFFAASAAAPAAALASLAGSIAGAAEPAAAEASAAGAGAATTGAGVTTTGAGAGAGASSFLPQAAKATAATKAAKTRDLFIFTILDELRKQFPEIANRNQNQNPSYVLTWERTRVLDSAINYMLKKTTLKTLRGLYLSRCGTEPAKKTTSPKDPKCWRGKRVRF